MRTAVRYTVAVTYIVAEIHHLSPGGSPKLRAKGGTRTAVLCVQWPIVACLSALSTLMPLTANQQHQATDAGNTLDTAKHLPIGEQPLFEAGYPLF